MYLVGTYCGVIDRRRAGCLKMISVVRFRRCWEMRGFALALGFARIVCLQDLDENDSFD